MNIIPRKTKVQIEFVKNVTLSDIIVGIIDLVVAIALFASNFTKKSQRYCDD